MTTPTRLQQLEEEYGILPSSSPGMIRAVMIRLCDHDDREHAHGMADALLCILLEQHGHADIVQAYDRLMRWCA